MSHPMRTEGEKRVLGKMFDGLPRKYVNFVVPRYFLIPAVVTSHVIDGDKHCDGHVQFVADSFDVSTEAVVSIVEGNSGEVGIGVAFAHVGIHIGELPVFFDKPKLPLEVLGGDGVETGLLVHIMVHQNHSETVYKTKVRL